MERVAFANDDWRVADGVAVRGRAVDPSGARVSLLDAFGAASDAADVVETAADLSGFFAAVVDRDGERCLVADHARSIPLYVTSEGLVTDAPTLVRDADPTYDPVAASEFVLTRYVTRGETVFADVTATRAGEVCVLDEHGLDRRRYWTYRPTARKRGDPADLLAEFAAVVGAVFDRVAAIAGDRPVLVPLSGGWDSRLVATELVARDCDVIAFTFGAPGHADVEVSRDVADALGCRWERVRYTTDRWHDWYHGDARRTYHDYAFGGDALPFLAEWPAVAELLADGRVPADALAVPGHTVATPSERVPAAWVEDTVDADDLVEYVLDEHYGLWDWDDPSLRRTFAARIRAEAGLDGHETGPAAVAAYETWEWTARMATFTHGDLRCYEFHGLDWWLPLWDPQYVAFWASVPLAQRHGKWLQREYTARRYAAVADVDDATARRTADDWTPFDQLRRTLATDPTAPFADSFDDWLGVQATPPERWESWGNYPLAWYGIVPEAEAGRFAAAPSLYSLRTLDAVGELALDDIEHASPPESSHLDLPRPAWVDAPNRSR
jgi:asparagine synthase (glutamine-hydrolysing)